MDPHGEEDQAWLKVMEVATLCILPMALKAALELKVMDIIAEHAGPEGGFLSAAQIAHHFPCPSSDSENKIAASAATSLDRILRLLASHGLLSSSFHTCTDGTSSNTYGLSSTSSLLLQTPPHQHSLAPFVFNLLDPVVLRTFYDLHRAVLDGTVPFQNTHGMPCFTYTQLDPTFSQVFNCSMAGHTHLVMQALLETYQGFDNITSLVDVGGGTGTSSSMIVAKHPHIKGINFDLDHVVVTAPKYPGVEHVGGDMFKEIPQADAIFMKWILHDWTDAHCLKILENCNKALPKEGKVIVVDAILPTKVDYRLPARLRYQMDLTMFALTEGGKERTKEELENLAKASGFNKLLVICNLHGLSIVELYK